MFHLDWSGFSNQAVLALKKHSPEILMGFGIGGMLTTSVLAVKATPEALRRIEKKKHDDKQKTLTAMQIIQAVWRCYIPAAVTGAVSTACLIGASSINGRRNAALATAYGLSETALHEYKDKVIETIGEKKEEAIRDAIDKDRIEKNPPSQDVLLREKCGKTLCYDVFCGRYFYSDMETLRRVVNDLNYRMATMCEPYISLNDFYLELDNPDAPPVELGDFLGWNTNKGLIKVCFSSQIARGTTPCLVVSFDIMPDYKFNEF